MSLDSLMTANQLAGRVAVAQTAAQTATAMPSTANIEPIVTASPTMWDKVKTFLDKEVITGTKIKWLYVVVAVGIFVVYVEFIADRKTKRSLKFW